MENIRNFAYGLCCISIVCGAFTAISPKFSEKIFRLITGLIIMLNILVFPSKYNLKDIFSGEPKTENIYSEEIIEISQNIYNKAVEKNIKSVINEELSRINILADEIELNMEIDENRNVKLNSVEITLWSKDFNRKKEVIDKINELGMEVKIYEREQLNES